MAIDTEKAKTSLEDDASIYSKRSDDDRTERQIFSEMNRHEKFVHYKTYYFKPTIVALLVVGLLVFFGYDILSKKDVVYHAVIINEVLDNKKVEAANTEFVEKYLKENINKKKASIELIYTNDTAQAVGASASEDTAKIATYMGASDLDCMIADKATIDRYNKNLHAAAFLDIRIMLKEKGGMSDTDIAKLKPYFYISTAEDSSKGKPIGIYVYNSPKYRTFYGIDPLVKNPIMAFVSNSKRVDASVKLVQYLFEDVLKK